MVGGRKCAKRARFFYLPLRVVAALELLFLFVQNAALPEQRLLFAFIIIIIIIIYCYYYYFRKIPNFKKRFSLLYWFSARRSKLLKTTLIRSIIVSALDTFFVHLSRMNRQ